MAFELQQRAIEQTTETMRRGFEAQQRLGETMFDFDPAMQAHETSFGAVRTSVDVYFDALESTGTVRSDLVGDLRAATHEQLTTLERTQAEHAETLEASLQGGSGPTDELLEEFVAMLDDHTEAMLEAHEDVEDLTVETFDGLEGDLEELQAAFEAHGEDVAESFDAQREAFDERISELQDQIEELTVRTTESASGNGGIQVEAVDESLEAIDGLGSTYSDRLHEQGIDSLEALTQADAQMVAETADVSRDVAAEWIETAQSSA